MHIDTFSAPLNTNVVNIENISIGNDNPIVFIAGPCVIESEEMTLKIAEELKEITTRNQIPFIFKASFDKADKRQSKRFNIFFILLAALTALSILFQGYFT